MALSFLLLQCTIHFVNGKRFRRPRTSAGFHHTVSATNCTRISPFFVIHLQARAPTAFANLFSFSHRDPPFHNVMPLVFHHAVNYIQLSLRATAIRAQQCTMLCPPDIFASSKYPRVGRIGRFSAPLAGSDHSAGTN